MHALSLQQPDDNWYFDTGATSHMTGSQGTLKSYSNLRALNKNITVGNGHKIPIYGYGHTSFSPPHPPIRLKNVLHSLFLIKNLISVRRLSIDNNLAIEFDPFGFTVKDYQTGIRLMRCNSQSDLYPFSSLVIQQLQPQALSAISQNIWHHRLGHPDAVILSLLRKNKSISCKHTKFPFLCQSCVFVTN